ncbi:hypothetical protein SE17_15385 [Kouleothrix aurantiaca]|uniref:Uncharacterized protein n=1 Tax=Kouleothrix aurantiaca TaxID=186479 RepID=A0A0P9D378_9CHLR|nr:hypothetical protein SE17_15385 [Kouleothrix aurantiaca]
MPRFVFSHVLKEQRREAQRLIRELHYSSSDGNQGFVHSVRIDDVTAAACLIGGTLSEGAERAIVAEGFACRQVKRLVARDNCPVPESQLLRMAMRDVANKVGPYMSISYADPVAIDARTGRSLLGWLYFAAGYFFIGFTSQPRYAVIDHEGALRSTRQGGITLTRRTLPRAGDDFQGQRVTKDWQMVKIPPARVWVAPVVPFTLGGEPTSRAWRKHQYLEMWRNLVPERKVWAQRWIDKRHWKQLLRDATVEQVEGPRQQTEHEILARGVWPGELMTRTAGPIWPIIEEQGHLFSEAEVAGEVTSGRRYWPRGEASDI